MQEINLNREDKFLNNKREVNVGYLFFKRLIDISISFLGLVILSPLLLLIAALIKLESKRS